MLDNSLSILIPAHNEESTIQIVIREYELILEELVQCALISDWQILVLDDGSTDNTLYLAKKISEKNPRIKIFSNEVNMGLASTFKKLYDLSDSDWSYVAPGDNQWPAENFRKLIKFWNKKNLIISSRNNRWQSYSLNRKIISALFSFLAKITVGISVHDPGAPKLIPTFLCKDLFLISPLVEIEILLRAKQNNIRITSAYLEFNKRVFGKSEGASKENLLMVTREFPNLIKLALTIRIFNSNIYKRLNFLPWFK